MVGGWDRSCVRGWDRSCVVVGGWDLSCVRVWDGSCVGRWWWSLVVGGGGSFWDRNRSCVRGWEWFIRSRCFGRGWFWNLRWGCVRSFKGVIRKKWCLGCRRGLDGGIRDNPLLIDKFSGKKKCRKVIKPRKQLVQNSSTTQQMKRKDKIKLQFVRG